MVQEVELKHKSSEDFAKKGVMFFHEDLATDWTK